jgi:hypothetical protein
MADEPEIEVQIEDNPPPTSQVEVPPEKAAAAPKTDPVAELKAQVETAQAERERERQGRQEADRQAQADRAARAAAERDAETVRSEISETRLSSVDAGIAAANAEIAAAENDSISAQEAGDWKRNTEAVKRLARAEATRMRLEEAKSDLESQRTSLEERPQRTQRQDAPAASSDPVEVFISGRASETQRWLRAHPEHARALAMTIAGQASVEEQRRSAKVNAAHNDAMGEGFAPDTPEYFAHVEEFLGMNKKEPEPAKTAAVPKKAAALVAPVSSADGGAMNGNSSVVKLSQREAMAAQDGTLIWNYPDPTGQNRWKKGEPIGIQEMARRKREGMKQGLYDKTWLEQ